MDTYKKLKNEFSVIMDGLDTESNESIKKRLDVLADEIETAITDLNQKRTAAFFPKASSKLKVDREMGFYEERTALEFLATAQTHNAIIDRLKNCMELGQIDYMSFIYKKLIPQIPKSESEWKKVPKDKVDFFRTIERMYNQFTNRSGIDFFDEQLELISGLKNSIKKGERLITFSETKTSKGKNLVSTETLTN
jgi:hypothetical protein